MMRKMFWVGAALTVATAGAVYLAAKQVDRHPYAVLGEAVAAVCGANRGTPIDPDLAPEYKEDEGLPADPVPAAPGGDSEEAAAGPAAPAPVVAVAEGPMPAHIVIEETPAPMTREGSTSGADCKDPTVIDLPAPVEPREPCPAVMPYAVDEGEAPEHMPRADEGHCAGNACHPVAVDFGFPAAKDGCAACQFFSFWVGFFGGPGDEPSPTSKPVKPAPGGAEEQTFPLGDCKEDRDRERHYPGCPAAGRPRPGRECPACPPGPTVEDVLKPIERDPTKSGKKINPRSSLVPKVHESKKCWCELEEEEKQELRPGIDTMEFRPSDMGRFPSFPRMF
jgi:hypothetical protein